LARVGIFSRRTNRTLVFATIREQQFPFPITVESVTSKVSIEQEHYQTQPQIYCVTIHMLTTRYIFRY